MKIINAIVYGPDYRFREGIVCTDGEYLSERSGDAAVIDGSGCYLVPGLVDIHLHGCAGYDFCGISTADPAYARETLSAMAAYETSRGITSFCPATMTLPEDRLTDILRAAAAYMQESGAFPHPLRPQLHADTCIPETVPIAGFYLEGPFLAPEKAGAQDRTALRLPDAGLFRRLGAAAGGRIRFLVLAPELEGADACIRELRNEVRISLGHTSADYATARSAFLLGAAQATHLYNAMSGMDHRSPGTVCAAADTPGVTAELICDGVHVHPAIVRQTFKLFGPERIILVSDSMAATGMPDGHYLLGGQDVQKQGNRAVLAGSDTLAGSVTDLQDCLRTAVLKIGIPPEDALRCATANPAMAAGIYDRCGSISTGKCADLLLLDRSDLSLRGVILRGRLLPGGTSLLS